MASTVPILLDIVVFILPCLPCFPDVADFAIGLKKKKKEKKEKKKSCVKRERENSKTLFYKDCSLGSVKNN